MRRSGPLKRRTPLRQVSSRRRRRDRGYPAARQAVFERAGGRCEARAAVSCTGRCEQVHHLAGRGGPDPHNLDNLLGVCFPCHLFIGANPGWAYANGLLRSRLSRGRTSPSSAMDTGGIRGGGA